MSPSPEKILVVGPSWVGDTVLATPVMANLRAAFPAARIYFLTTAWSAGILSGHPDVDEVRVRPGGTRGDFRAALALRRDGVEWAIVLPNSMRGALLAAASGACRRTGYARDGRSALLTEAVPYREDSGRHQVDEYLGLLEAAGVAVTRRTPRVTVSEEAAAFAEETFRKAGIGPDDPVVGIQPGAKFGATKLWPAERFAAVGDRLARSEGARIVLLGSPEEARLTARIATRMKPGALDLAGKDDLFVLPGVLRRLTVFLTGDTGPMHIAAAVGTRVVALFGPTDPRHTGPVDADPADTAPVEKGHAALRRELFCSPCFLKKCPYGHECMEEMTVEEVYGAVRERLRVPAVNRSGG